LLDQELANKVSPRLRNEVLKRANSFVWGVWKQVSVPASADDTIHTVTQGQGGRLDALASEFYGNPNLWWVIAQENGVKDPLQGLVPGSRLRISSFTNVMSVALDSARQTRKPLVEGVAT
jgi:hypothetical protein